MLAGQRRIERRKVSDELAERLAGVIVAEGMTPGAMLPSERDLMEAFGVGRSSVREALYALRKQGVIEVRSGERARVAQPSARVIISEMTPAARRLLVAPEGVRQFQDARSLFETGVAERAAILADADDLARLRAALDANVAALGNQAAFERTDIAFHLELARIARNPIFVALHEAITEWLTEQRSVSGRRRDAGPLAIAAHERILRAIEAHDPAAAAEAMRTHLAEVAALYWQAASRGKRAG